ncbi:MAG: hypothetical protein MZW92_55545 [Comamonadaceae bacterium]|nr:hypothetical protein [Comamonadaceae bacterium]
MTPSATFALPVGAARKPAARLGAHAGCGAWLSAASSQATTALADQPLLADHRRAGQRGAGACRVEYPTAVSVAHQGAFVAGDAELPRLLRPREVLPSTTRRRARESR